MTLGRDVRAAAARPVTVIADALGELAVLRRRWIRRDSKPRCSIGTPT